MKTEAPSLEKLKTEQCTLEELQASLLLLIELHNNLSNRIQDFVASGQISSKKVAVVNKIYGLGV